MKAEFKRRRDAKKIAGRTIGRLFRFIVLAAVAFLALMWIYPRIHLIGFRKIDVKEVAAYYDLLSKNAKPAQGLVLDLGVKDSDRLITALVRLKSIMGLDAYAISLGRHDKDKPPAYITDYGYGQMKILISDKVKNRREELNLLVHELGHIYVKRLDISIFGKLDQEKLVDCSGMFLGLGILTLNGLTDEFNLVLGGGYEEQKKVYGYLKPEQYGYMLARYCADHGINYDAVRPSLNSTGKKYFYMGRDYITKTGYIPAEPIGPPYGISWSAGSGSPERVSLAKGE